MFKTSEDVILDLVYQIVDVGLSDDPLADFDLESVFNECYEWREGKFFLKAQPAELDISIRNNRK